MATFFIPRLSTIFIITIFHIKLTILSKSQIIPVVHSYDTLHELKADVNDNQTKSRIQQEIYQIPLKKNIHLVHAVSFFKHKSSQQEHKPFPLNSICQLLVGHF